MSSAFVISPESCRSYSAWHDHLRSSLAPFACLKICLPWDGFWSCLVTRVCNRMQRPFATRCLIRVKEWTFKKFKKSKKVSFGTRFERIHPRDFAVGRVETHRDFQGCGRRGVLGRDCNVVDIAAICPSALLQHILQHAPPVSRLLRILRLPCWLEPYRRGHGFGVPLLHRSVPALGAISETCDWSVRSGAIERRYWVEDSKAPRY